MLEAPKYFLRSRFVFFSMIALSTADIASAIGSEGILVEGQEPVD